MIMKQTTLSQSVIRAVAIIVGTIVLTLTALSIMMGYDNKYISKAALT